MTIKVSKYVRGKIGRTKKDFKVDHYTVGGPGGGGKDTSNTGVRITDRITGIQSTCNETRSQQQNHKRAFERLVDKLVLHYKEEELKNRAKESGMENTGWIRTYIEKGSKVIDKRIPDKEFDLQEVLDGNLDPIHRELIKPE